MSVVLVGVTLAAATGFLHAQQVPILSGRTGGVVSAAAREYFGLFPRVAGFRSATFRTLDGGAIGADIHRPAVFGGDTMVSMSRSVFTCMARWVDSFEVYHVVQRPKRFFDSLRGVVHSTMTFPEEPTPFAVDTLGGGTVNGTLLYADDTVVVLGPDTYEPKQGPPPLDLNIIRTCDIDRLHNRASGLNNILDGFEMELGGNDTLYRRYAAAALRDVALFRTMPPPEVLHALERSMPGRHTGPPTMTVAQFEDQHRVSSLHLSLLYRVAGNLDHVLNGVRLGGPFSSSRDIAEMGPTFPCIGIEYDAASDVRLGVWGSWTAPNNSSRSVLFNYTTVYGFSATATMRWLILHARHVRDLSSDVCDVAIGGGPTLRLLYRDDDDTSTALGSSRTRNATTTSATMVGMTANVGIDIYLSDRWSINGEARYSVFNNSRLWTPMEMPGYEVHLSPWEFLLGIGWHP